MDKKNTIIGVLLLCAAFYFMFDSNKEAELARLTKEYKQVEKLLAQDEGKLNNAGFMSKAPEAVVEKIKAQAAREREQLSLIQAAIDALK